MKEKRYVSLSDYERWLIILSLNKLSNFVITDWIMEQVKAEDQMLWVQRMNAVRETATEIVNNDLIYA